jgi:16S rRNA (cytidine1402-2'-O)-methyltransferase
MHSNKTGALYLVATPIGNLDDITIRAIKTLQECDLIACEDTRKTRRLLDHVEISTKTISYHEHNEHQQAIRLAAQIQSGKSIALVCNAGTPTISDPGFRLVRECRSRNLDVIPVPGASACLAALSASAIPSDRFLFVGFLAPKKAARQRFFEQYKNSEYTLIFYESCHRIEKFLDDLLEIFGPDRTVCVAREITKIYETFNIGTLAMVCKNVKKQSKKGEFVILVAKEQF